MFIDIDNKIARTASADDFRLLIKHLWISPLANNPDQEIVYRDRQRFTYRQTHGRIGRLASSLAAIGVAPGTTVAVMDVDSHRYLECFFAIPMMGCVLQTVNVRLSPEHMLYTLNQADAGVILVNAQFLPLLASLRARLARRVQVIVLDDGDEPVAPAVMPWCLGEYEALLAQASPDYPFPDFDEDTRATTFFTSGTTGQPKGCYFSHRQLVLHTLGTAATFGTAPVQGRLHREDVYLPITPMFHVHAWGMPYVATLLGLKQVYPGAYDPEVLLRLIRDEGVTFAHCVPTLLHMLLTHPSSKDTDLSKLKMLVGGSSMSQGLCRQALERGLDVFTGYGMSETCPIQVVNHLTGSQASQDLDTQVGLRVHTGHPALLCDVSVVDADGQKLPHDGSSQGEIVFRSPWLTQGYLGEPAHSEALWKGGHLHSGDVGTIGPDGCLQVQDRLKDVIKTGGEWISSLALEDLISQYPGVSEVAVIAVPDAKWNERPLALVVARQGSMLEPQAIRQHLVECARNGMIAKYGVPEHVLIVESLARTSVGKIDKKALRQRHAPPLP